MQVEIHQDYPVHESAGVAPAPVVTGVGLPHETFRELHRSLVPRPLVEQKETEIAVSLAKGLVVFNCFTVFVNCVVHLFLSFMTQPQHKMSRSPVGTEFQNLFSDFVRFSHDKSASAGRSTFAFVHAPVE